MEAIAVVLVLTGGAFRADAETFECQKPTSPLARLICADPLLRTADAEETGIYDAAVTASLDRPALREEERAWFAREILPYNWFADHQMPINNGDVIDAYRKRADALRQQTRLWRKLRHGVPGATLAASCLALPIDPNSGGCWVAAFAPVAGAPALRYQLQLFSGPAAHNAVVIFAATQDQPDTWLPLAVRMSKGGTLDAPQASASPFGVLLTVAGSGSGDDNGSALYRLAPDALEDIDDRSWLETLHVHLPDGLALSPEITADYAKMQAAATVSRSQSTCCPVGAQARIDLAIDNDRVVVSGVTFGGPEGPRNSNQN